MKLHLPPLPFLGLLAAVIIGASMFAQTDRLSAQAPVTANINVTPLRLELASQDDATQLLIRNQGETRVALQLRAFEWVQRDGRDDYRPTGDITLSPSIVRIEPKRAQTFHVLSRSEHRGGAERAFRVVIDELPGQVEKTPGTAQTRLRLTIPLFIGSEQARFGQIGVSARRGELLLANAGGRTTRLTHIRLDADGEMIDLGPRAALAYVHGRSWISIPVPDGVVCEASHLRVRAETDQGTIDEIARSDCP